MLAMLACMLSALEAMLSELLLRCNLAVIIFSRLSGNLLLEAASNAPEIATVLGTAIMTRGCASARRGGRGTTARPFRSDLALIDSVVPMTSAMTPSATAIRTAGTSTGMTEEACTRAVQVTAR